MSKIISIAADHAGYELKTKVVTYLEKKGYVVKDYGTNSSESVDYPSIVHPLGRDISEGKDLMGIVICGSGNGVQMTVNKYKNVRAALCWETDIAKLARQHNNANVLALPARFISDVLAFDIVDTFLSTDFEGGRHQRRVDMINSTL